MADIRRVSPDFAVAPQIAVEDLPAVAAERYRLVINNRPDGEAPGQPTAAEIGAAAHAAGLDYVHLPIVGGPTPAQVSAVRAAVEGADGPVLAFCRSGTRSIVAWSLGQAQAGRSTEELIALGRVAGYDLGGVLAGV